MHSRLFLFISYIFFYSFINYCYAQDIHENRVTRIQKLLSNSESLKKDWGYDSQSKTIYGRELIYKNDENGISYIGIRLFNDSIKKNTLPYICNFLEEYLLELSLLTNQEQLSEELEKNQTKIRLQNIYLKNKSFAIRDLIKVLDTNFSFTIHVTSTQYVAQWNISPNGMILLSFPKKYELIFGKEKVEMEKSFFSILNKYTNKNRVCTIDRESLQFSRDNYYILPGKYYQTEQINNSLFFTISSDKISYLFDEKYIKESMNNLFTSADIMNVNFTLDITQYMYAKNERSWKVDIKKFLSFLVEDGCEIFTGVETIDKKNINGSVFFVNDMFGYNHLMNYVFPIDEFNDKDAIIKVSLYTYIPTHNVVTLFGDIKDKTN